MYNNIVQNNNYASTTTVSRANMAILGSERQPSLENNKCSQSKKKIDLRKECHRPTYGAYLYNSLPRGPYLQYKINDQQQSAQRKITNDNDNNEKKQNMELHQHQAQTARDSFTLPRAKINMAANQCNCRIYHNPCSYSVQLSQNFPSESDIAHQDKRDQSPIKGTYAVHNQPQHLKCNATMQNREEFIAIERKPTEVTTKDNQTLPFQYRTWQNGDAVPYQIETSGVAKRKFNIDGPEIKSNHRNLKATPTNGNDFLKQIQEKNSDMLARISAAALSHHFWVPPCPNPPALVSGAAFGGTNLLGKFKLSSGKSLSEFSQPMNNSSNPVQVNFVTLADVIRVRSEGLSELEGWAVLCQSVQALQDLFLADTPSTSRIIPLVRSSTIQITSRGRIVFSLISASQFNKLIDAISYFDVTCQLSPEYLRNMSKRVIFAESDIEKMWIYSLGVTLRQAIKHHPHQKLPATKTYQPVGSNGVNLNTLNPQMDIVDNIIKPATIPEITENSIVPDYNVYMLGRTQFVDSIEDTLDQVIACMCEQNLQHRASLMYLLDVISSYCRNQQQAKPFSHIVMDIFKEVVNASQKEKPFKVERNQNSDEIKSETDSGRGSTHGDRDILSVNSGTEGGFPTKTNLKLINRTYSNAESDKFRTIGYAGITNLQVNPEATSRPPLVVRRSNKSVRQKNDFRRKTIDVNLFDLEKARQEMAFTNNKEDLNLSRSTNFIDKIVVFENNGLQKSNDFEDPMRDVIPRKTVSVANLKVRRQTSRNLEYLTKAYSEESFLMKAKGPEFIVKSSLPSRELNICELKCQHCGVVNILLLDGQTIYITCNSLTTTSGEIFEALVKSERYVENYFLGLCALIGGDFVFLPSDLKIYKVAPQNWANKSAKQTTAKNVFFTLFLRVKFFLPTLRGISSLESRHMMYLQLRKSILEKHILATEDDLIFLGGLALQAEVGDFKESMKYSEYFTISHYLPEGVYHRNKEMGKYLRNSHYCRQGIHPKEAEQSFIKYVQEMKEYGFHLYSAVWASDDDRLIDVYVGISLVGLTVFERNLNPRANAATNSKTSYQRKLYLNFEWPEIENLCFSKHILCIAVRKTESLKAKDNNRIKYKLRMDDRKSYFAFSLASEHHQFYMKLRNSFISLKSLSDELNIPITAPPSQNKHAGGMETYGILPNEMSSGKSSNVCSNMLPENIKKIDKQLKASAAVRVRNLKKSMLNDNRLLKLKEKFLRRSKSTVGTGDCKKKVDLKDKDKNRDMNNLKTELQAPSKEESQNKENECPRAYLNEVPPKVYSPSRNRVKMGTRVFSSQFLNKSFDNIYERALNGQQFESTTSIDNDHINEDCDILDRKVRRLDIFGAEKYAAKSASSNSLCGVEPFSDNSLPNEAYVIHTSIKNHQDNFCNFSLPNESISESLLERFNNISCNNTVNDRVLTKLSIVKERLNTSSSEKKVECATERDPIKYATVGKRMVAEVAAQHCLRHGNENGKKVENMANRRQPKGLWQLSRSQESIFIDNKFSLKNEHINQTSMENDLDGFTLGISIIQGSDNNVYVKDLVQNGPGARAGIQIGDQIIAVNGISLLNLSYEQSLNVLQNTGQVVQLIVSQIVKKKEPIKSSTPHCHDSQNKVDLCPSPPQKADSMKVINNVKTTKLLAKGRSRSINVTTTTNYLQYLKDIKFQTNDVSQRSDSDHLEMCPIPSRTVANKTTTNLSGSNSRSNTHNNLQLTREKFKSGGSLNRNLHPLTAAKSVPDLPKVVAIIPKRTCEVTEKKKIPLLQTTGNSRKYLGPVRYPVTPIKTVSTPLKHHLSLLADSDDDQVFI